MIERMGGPLILRILDHKGMTTYWNWDTVSSFRIQEESGAISFKDGSAQFLSPEEAKQVAAQLDILIDPPTTMSHEARVALSAAVIGEYQAGKLTMGQAMELLGIEDPR